MKKGSLLMLGLAAAATALAACSSGGGGSAPAAPTGTAALTVTESVNVVEPKISAALAAVKPLRMAASVPADSDYMTDKTNVYMEERSVEGFRTINEILCMVGQTKYDEMLNSGVYLALVDQGKCSAEKSDTSSAGQEAQNRSSGSDAPRYMKWIVEATRTNNNSPEYLKAWIHEPAQPGGNEPAKIIFAKVTITEGKSDANPIGIFVINFRAVAEANPTQEIFRGVLKAERDTATGKILLKFATDNAMYLAHEEATLDKGVDPATGTFDGTGRGEVHAACDDPQNLFDATTSIAYNKDYFHRVDASTDVCLDRNDFAHSAWSYGLYDNTTGSRINRNSGFSINTRQDGTGSYGWVGYWGVWLDSASGLTNNQTVYNIDYRTRTSTPYSVFLANGKLKKHTRDNLTLAEVKGVPMDFWEQDQQGGGTQYRVVWDGTAQQFNKVAQMVCNGDNCTWQAVVTNPTPTIDVGHLPWSELNFWSQSLGGQVRVPLGPCSYVTTTIPSYTDCSLSPPVNTTQVVFYREDIVYPGDATVPATLACYDNCLQADGGGVITSDPMVQSVWSSTLGQVVAKNYAFDPAALDLKDGIYSVVSNTTGNGNEWGYSTGALFDDTNQNNMNLLTCDWDPNLVCAFKAWSVLPVFYTWETGPNTWNRFTGLKDGTGAYKTFEPPLQVKYVNGSGATYMLEYAGFGQLQGIPGKCVDMDTGADADCAAGAGAAIRWVPEFTILADETVVDSANVTYLVKPLEIEERMKQAASPASCSNLTIGSYTLPTMAEWTTPGIGPEPALTDPPAVIGGIVQ